MSDKEAIAILENLRIQGKAFFSQRLALYKGIKAIEVVEKIKKAFHNGWFEDDIYNILCEAYGSDADCESWMKEAEDE